MWTNKTAGSIGLALSLLLWIVSKWRVLFHLLLRSRSRRRQQHELINRRAESSSRWDWFTHRRSFHTLLWLAMTVECIAYADVARVLPLSQNREFAEKLGYVLLEVVGRAMFEFNAFSVVTLMWLRTAVTSTSVGSRLEKVASRLLVATGIVLSCLSVWQAVDILSRSKGSSLVYRAHLIIEGASWGVQASVAAICSHLTARRILRLSTLPPSGTLDMALILAKPLVPMLLCTMCYAIRSVWLVARALHLPTTSSIPDRFSAAWWIGFVWVPTLVPSMMLLYSARKRDPQPINTESMDRAQSPLLPTPVPPAEAFISFRRFQQGDIFSPLTPNSPRTFTQRVLETDGNAKEHTREPREDASDAEVRVGAQ